MDLKQRVSNPPYGRHERHGSSFKDSHTLSAQAPTWSYRSSFAVCASLREIVPEELSARQATLIALSI